MQSGPKRSSGIDGTSQGRRERLKAERDNTKVIRQSGYTNSDLF